MRKIGLMFLLGLGVLLFNSCKKGTQPTAVVVGMTYKVDGIAKTATTVVATILNLPDGKRLLINGISTPDAITIIIDNAGIGTYFNGRQSSLVSSVYSNGSGSFLAETNGSVIITSFINNNLSGTFQFTGTGNVDNITKVITDGQFNCKMVTQ